MTLALWDIETAKMATEELTYSLKNHSKYRSSKVITRPIWMPCASWKIYGQKKIHTVSVLDDPKRFKKRYWDDYIVVKTLRDLMDEVDVIIAHNGDNFDWKILKARVIYHNLKPMPDVVKVDTLKLARSQFRFEANDLRYLAWYMGVAEKTETPNWDLVSTGDVKEIKKCISYNRDDIPPLEGVFDRLKAHTKIRLFKGNGICPVCGSSHCQSRGPSEDKKKQRFVCLNCGKWRTEKK